MYTVTVEELGDQEKLQRWVTQPCMRLQNIKPAQSQQALTSQNLEFQTPFSLSTLNIYLFSFCLGKAFLKHILRAKAHPTLEAPLRLSALQAFVLQGLLVILAVGARPLWLVGLFFFSPSQSPAAREVQVWCQHKYSVHCRKVYK